MRRCCDWWGWSVRKLEHIARLNIRRPNMVKPALMYLKQNWKWMLTRLWKNENIGQYIGYSKESNRGFRGGRSRSQPPCSPSCFRNYSYFCIEARAEDVVKLSSKVSDENGRENQTKTRWVWSGRHNENGMGCGKRKWWEKVLWWGEKFPRLLLRVMDVKLAGLIVTLGGDWGVQAPWELMPLKL